MLAYLSETFICGGELEIVMGPHWVIFNFLLFKMCYFELNSFDLFAGLNWECHGTNSKAEELTSFLCLFLQQFCIGSKQNCKQLACLVGWSVEFFVKLKYRAFLTFKECVFLESYDLFIKSGNNEGITKTWWRLLLVVPIIFFLSYCK